MTPDNLLGHPELFSSYMVDQMGRIEIYNSNKTHAHGYECHKAYYE